MSPHFLERHLDAAAAGIQANDLLGGLSYSAQSTGNAHGSARLRSRRIIQIELDFK